MTLRSRVRYGWKRLKFKIFCYGVKEEERISFRKSRQEQIRSVKNLMRRDLVNRDHVGDIILDPNDRASLAVRVLSIPFLKLESIYRKYL